MGYSQWKVLILDEGSKKLVDTVVKEDDILQENVTSVLMPFWFKCTALKLRTC